MRIFFFLNQVQPLCDTDVKMKQYILWYPFFYAGNYFHLSYCHYRRNHHHRGMSTEMKEIGDRILMNCTATIKSHCIHSICVHTHCTRASLYQKEKPQFHSVFHITVANGKDAPSFHLLLFTANTLSFSSILQLGIITHASSIRKSTRIVRVHVAVIINAVCSKLRSFAPRALLLALRRYFIFLFFGLAFCHICYDIKVFKKQLYIYDIPFNSSHFF